MKYILYIITFLVLPFSLISQTAIKLIPFINQSFYKKAVVSVDSFDVSTENIDNYNKVVSDRAKLFLQLDSMVKTSNEVAFYFSTDKSRFFSYQLIDSTGKYRVHYKQYKRNGINSIRKALEKVLNECENNGYPFAEIFLDSLFQIKNRINLQYKLLLNKKIIYDSLDIIGKPPLSKKFLMVYTGLIPMKIYSEKTIKKLDVLLKAIPFIRIQKPSDLYFIDDKAKIRSYLSKQSANSFSGLIGISNGEKDQIKFTGDLNISLKNIFKHADSWDFVWKKTGEQSQQLNVHLSIPYIFSYPIGVLGLLNIDKQDSTYINSRYKVGLMFYSNGFNGVSVYFEKKETSVLNSATIDYTKYASTSGNYAGLNFLFYRYDKIILPTSGAYFTFDAAYGKKSINKNTLMPDSVYNQLTKTSDQWKMSLYNIYLIPVKNPFFLKIKLDAAYLKDAKYINELYKLGGSQSIRGFDEERITAYKYLLISGEWRWELDHATQIFAFYDKLMYKSINASDNPWGIGIGAELNTSAGLFFISYGIGSQFNHPLEMRNSKIHFGYKNNF